MVKKVSRMWMVLYINLIIKCEYISINEFVLAEWWKIKYETYKLLNKLINTI